MCYLFEPKASELAYLMVLLESQRILSLNFYAGTTELDHGRIQPLCSTSGKAVAFVQLGQKLQVCFLDAFLPTAVAECLSLDIGQRSFPCGQFCCCKWLLIISNRAAKPPGRT